MMKSFVHTPLYQSVFSLLFMALFFAYASVAYGQNRNTSSQYVPGEIILKYEPISRSLASSQNIESEHRQIANILSRQFRLPAVHSEPIHTSLVEKMVGQNTTELDILSSTSRNKNANKDFANLNLSRKLLFRFSDGIDVLEIISQIETNKSIFTQSGYQLVHISPNYIFEKQQTPSDPLYKFQWGHQIAQAESAWDITKGDPNVIIAVIDTGIDELNPDVADKLVAGFDFVNVNINAYEDWQLFEGEDYSIQDDDPTDTDGHGTHVAGIAAARGFDDFGITGVCPDCSIMPIRAGAQFYRLDDENEEDTVLTSLFNGANVSDAIFHAVENGADVINMSFGGEGRTSYQDVLTLAQNSGVVLIAAAGNDDTQTAFYPAFFPEVLAVASTDNEDKKSDFSNYGTWIDVSAPGSAILSAYPEDLGASVSESTLTINGETFETTIFTFSGYTSEEGIEGNLVYVGLAREEDLSNPNYNWDNLEGNIAYIQRGEITFREKVDRVKTRGAKGAIIFNHQEGPVFGTLGEARDNPVPVLGLTKADGDAILNSINTQTQAAKLNVELLSEMHTFNSGTSMAAPYVAGMAGLLLSEEPDLTPDEVKARIIASVDLIDQENLDYQGLLGSGRVTLSTLFDPIVPPSGENQLNLYPNPTSGAFRVELFTEDRGEVRVKVFNLIGSLIQDNTFDKQASFWNVNIDLGNIPTGVYLVQVEHGNLKEVKKVVKR